MVGDVPTVVAFCCRNSISPKSKWVHESFLSHNISRDCKNILCGFSVGMELEIEKTEMRHHNYEDYFFSVPYAIKKTFIAQASSVKMAGYWSRSLLAFAWPSITSRSIKTQKENLTSIQPSWLLVKNIYVSTH